VPGVDLWHELDHGVGGGEADPSEDGEGESESHEGLRHGLPPVGADDDAHLLVVELSIAVTFLLHIVPVILSIAASMLAPPR